MQNVSKLDQNPPSLEENFSPFWVSIFTCTKLLNLQEFCQKDPLCVQE